MGGAQDAVERTDGEQGAAAGRLTTARRLAVVEGLLLVTAGPGLAVILLWRPPVWLVGVALLPVGPALAAALFAWRKLDAVGGSAAAHFWRGYRLDVVDAVRVWVPGLVLLFLLSGAFAASFDFQVPLLAAALAGLATAAVTAWVTHALLVAAVFSFRLGDTARIAGYFVLSRATASVRAVALVAIAVGGVLLGAGWLVVLLASVFSLLLWRSQRPVAAEIERRFVVGAPDAVQAKPWPGLDDLPEVDVEDQPDGD